MGATFRCSQICQTSSFSDLRVSVISVVNLILLGLRAQPALGNMIFGRKKESAIDRRLQELQKEMGKVGTDIKSLSRYAKTKAGGPAFVPAPGNARVAAPQTERADAASSPVNSSTDVQPRPAVPDDLLSQEQNSAKESPFFPDDAAKGGSGDMPLFEPRSPLSATGREKFANYFMAGHFTNLRPLRQEKRIVRNKAIVMSVLVVIALVWLFFYLYNR